MSADVTKAVTDIEAVNAIIPIVHDAAAEYMRRQRAGASGSMNGALEYVEFSILNKLREIGWKP